MYYVVYHSMITPRLMVNTRRLLRMRNWESTCLTTSSLLWGRALRKQSIGSLLITKPLVSRSLFVSTNIDILDLTLIDNMDLILNRQFEKCLEEYRIGNEVKECVNSMLSKLELDEKDSIMYIMSCWGINTREDLNKQILQLKQENTIMEEANARYSKLQLIEAEVLWTSTTIYS